MYCPNCGQQQVSNELKFCSRCGLPLGLVAEVLANGGFLPQLAELNQKKPRLTKKHGVLFSVFWFIFFILILTPFFGIVNAPDELTGMSAIIGVFGSLMLLIASLTLLKSSKNETQFGAYQQNFPPLQAAPPPNLYQTNVNQLPPQQSQPVSSFVPPSAGSWKAPDTGELVRPQSVTEDTTKLLNKDQL